MSNIINKSINKPKAWVFTGWKKPINEFNNDFVRDKFKILKEILKEYSVTEFTIHMEIWVYRKFRNDGSINTDFGKAYLHFHVVTGGINELSKVRNIWGREVKYENAIKPINLGFYVSKYASKTPIFDDERLREYYHLLVYKTIMHYFSVKVSESQRKIFNENYKSYFITIDILKLEVDRIRKYSPYYKQYIYAINWREYYKKKNRNIHKTLDSDFKEYNNENKTRLKNTG